MSSSPILWGPNSIAANLENGVLQANGMLNSQQGPVNYISYGNFANNATTGWSLGTVGTLTNGIPTGTPTFGSGTTALTLTTAASSQSLSGYALSLVAASATTVGNMMATQAYTIATEDQAKVLTFKFYYSTPSGVANCNFSGTSSNSFGIAIWDTTNSVWLSSTANFGMTQSSGVGYVTGTCQTNSTTASLQFVVYAVNATTGAATLYFTDFFLGPQTAPIGYCGTDWTSYTPTTQGFGTSPIINYAQWRRVGDSIQIQASVTTGTTPTATLAEISLPSGLTVHSSISQNTAVAYFGVNTNVATSFQVNVNASNSTFLTFGRQDATNNGLTNANGSTLFGSAETFSFTTAPIKINGLSSNVQMSSDTDTRVVEAKAKATGTRTPTTSKAVNYDTVLSDTHGALTTVAGDTTGWKFTAPISGFYVVDGVYYISAGATSATMYVYINGTQDQALGSAVSTNTVQSFSATVKLNAGDFIDIRSDSTPTTGNASNLNQICVKRLSGPSVIAATESVSLSYYGYTSGITGTSNATVLFATKVKDTHNGYASGIYTVPVTGMYHVNAGLLLATSGTPVVGTTFADLQIVQAGSASQVLEDKCFIPTANTTIAAAGYPLIVAGMLYCLAGDTIKVQGSVNLATASAAASNTMNFFSVARVGN